MTPSDPIVIALAPEVLSILHCFLWLGVATLALDLLKTIGRKR